jgi:hypothetical protein
MDQRDEYEELLIFTDEFMLEPKINTGMDKKDKDFSETNVNSTFLSQLVSIPNKLFEKLNG